MRNAGLAATLSSFSHAACASAMSFAHAFARSASASGESFAASSAEAHRLLNGSDLSSAAPLAPRYTATQLCAFVCGGVLRV